MAFIQVIEITTTRPDEVEALVGEWRTKTAGRRTAQRGTFTQDSERPNTYVQIVEFPSYEDAMANSDLPQTAAFADQLAQLCDGPISFRNLDVRSTEEMQRRQSGYRKETPQGTQSCRLQGLPEREWLHARHLRRGRRSGDSCHPACSRRPRS